MATMQLCHFLSKKRGKRMVVSSTELEISPKRSLLE